MPPRSRGTVLVLLRRAVSISTESTTAPAVRPSLYCSCRGSLRPSAFHPTRLPLYRSFTTSPPLSKKGSAPSKSSRNSASPSEHPHVPNNKATASRDAELDPYDHTDLEAGIATAITRLKDALTKTRDAGRVTSEMLEALPVELPSKSGGGGLGNKARTRVDDIASVVPKGGRIMQVFCGEEAHVKPIAAAIQSSPYSLVPAPDAQNSLLLLVPVPPATAETRAQAAVEAKKVMEKANTDVRNARGDAQKRFRKMELGKLVVVDELRKAHKGMEEVVKKGMDEVKRVYEGALKSLER